MIEASFNNCPHIHRKMHMFFLNKKQGKKLYSCLKFTTSEHVVHSIGNTCIGQTAQNKLNLYPTSRHTNLSIIEHQSYLICYLQSTI